jgi:hypothetical protein
MSKLKSLIFNLLLVLSLSASYSLMALEQRNSLFGSEKRGSTIWDTANGLAISASKTAKFLVHHCLPNSHQIAGLLLLCFAESTIAQNNTDYDQCMAMLSQCQNNTTASLNQIIENTTPVPWASSYTLYAYAAGGFWVSLVGGILTCICDPGSALWSSHKTERKLAAKLEKAKSEIVDDLKSIMVQQEGVNNQDRRYSDLENKFNISNFLLVQIVDKLPNKIDRETAFRRLNRCLKRCSDWPNDLSADLHKLVDFIEDALNLSKDEAIAIPSKGQDNST